MSSGDLSECPLRFAKLVVEDWLSEAGRFIVPRRSTRGEKPLGISTRSNRTSNWRNTPRDDDRIRSVFHQGSPYISVRLMWIWIVLCFLFIFERKKRLSPNTSKIGIVVGYIFAL